MTPEIKPAEEVVKDSGYDDHAMDFAAHSQVIHVSDVVKLITQDRAALHTSLVAAVEGMETEERDEYGVKYKSAKELKQDFLTIINSIFKE